MNTLNLSLTRILIFKHFPDEDFVDKSLDSEYHPINQDFSDVRVDTSKGVRGERNFDFLVPVLETAVPHIRDRTQRQTLLALWKRNMNVPNISTLVDYEVQRHLMVSRFKSMFVRDHAAFSALRDTVVGVNVDGIANWLQSQAPNVIDKINDEENPLCCFDWTKYDFMIKCTPKVQMTQGECNVYAALQTIAYHPKSVKALFSPVFREMKQRMLSFLRHPMSSIRSMTKKILFVVLTGLSTIL